ncbi:MAG: M23 family metallopeptidase [Cytophagales bacterium]
MGELRTNHFHGGLDIKTDQKTGLPVHAAADGYISRISVQHKGYGNALYITHPNGLITVYGHLEWFNGAIDTFITNFLYQEQCNETDLLVEKGKLVVRKGQIVAFSGNTGSSGGPHLHWEIRDNEERLLNPLFFDFPEIVDKQLPVVNKIALRTFGIDSRIEGEFGRVEYIPVREINNFVLRFPIHAWGTIGLELRTYDKMDGTSNLYGISIIEMTVDKKKVFTHDIQRIGFDENPYINAHIDYEMAQRYRTFFQRCYVSDGNELKTYAVEKESGKIFINDTLVHDVSVKITDAYRNFTTLNFKIKGTRNQLTKPVSSFSKPKGKTKRVINYLRHAEFENILKVECLGNKENGAALYFKSKKVDVEPVYAKSNEQVYLWDLRSALPDSIIAGKQKHIFNFKEVVPSRNAVNYSSPNIDIIFPKKAVFDTLFLDLSFSDRIFTIQRPTIPLFAPVSIVLKPDFEIKNKAKAAVYNLDAKRRGKFSGGIWTNNTIKFGTKIFGDFTIKEDTISPKITYFRTLGNTLYFKMSDNLSGVQHWYGYLNGEFVVMQYEAKYNVIFTKCKDNAKPLKGDFVLGAVDNMGNMTEIKFTF